ncbi:MAG: hypothetical protein ABSD80_10410 [Caulobacteraceae bacterium]|jgi:hypothetical protein
MTIATLALAACASAGGSDYSVGPGVANYDNLKAATDKCAADGGTLTLKDGYEKSDLSSWVCKMGGAK